MKEDRQFVTALARGLEVLRCFTPDRPELSSTEIAAITGLPQPTVWRLCYTLAKLGYLVKGRGNERLRVSPIVLTLGHAVVTNTEMTEFADPLMHEIADTHTASVSLATRDDLAMVIVHRAEAQSILRLSLSKGSSLDLATSALGWAYMAGAEPAVRDDVLKAIRRAQPGRFDAIARNIEAAVAQYERSGFVFNLRHYHPDVNAIGVPVFSRTGKVAMALNCGGANSIVTKEKLAGPIAQALQRVARDLSPFIEGAAPPPRPPG